MNMQVESNIRLFMNDWIPQANRPRPLIERHSYYTQLHLQPSIDN